jgi:hypothetical protein
LDVLVGGLPASLRLLRLDLGFTSLRSLGSLSSLAAPSLAHVSLRLTGSALETVQGLEVLATLPIRRLELWLLSLPLRDLGPLIIVLPTLDLEELTLSVSHCPHLTPASVRELRAAARHLKRRRGSKLTMWLDLQDIRLCLMIGAQRTHTTNYG